MSIGPILALSCAFLWSVSIILFKLGGERTHPFLLNLLKNSIGLALMLITMFAIEPVVDISSANWLHLLASGFLGIGVADGLLLYSLSRVGASRFAIIECSYAPAIALFAFLLFAEDFGLAQILGGTLIISGVAILNESKAEAIARRDLYIGAAAGLAAMLLMGWGIVSIRPLFTEVPLTQVVTVRLIGGVVASVMLWLSRTEPLGSLRSFWDDEKRGMVIIACVTSTYFAMMMWVAGFKYNSSTTAAVLNQTSTIFTVVLAVIVLGEAFTRRKLVALTLAVAGVLLVLSNTPAAAGG